MTLSLYLVAGEPSGDRLGAGLMRALKELAPAVRFRGVGGPAMTAEGLTSRFDMSELSVMGLAEVVPRLPRLVRRLRDTAADVVASAPDALVTIDSPGFTLRLAEKVRAGAPGVRTIHYVAPSVWAWRPGRAAKMARSVDHVLALLPFEPAYMTAAGIGCDFVGHPVAAAPRATEADIAAFRRRAGAELGPLLLVAPGSRTGVVRRMMPLYAAAAERLMRGRPGLRIAVPVAAAAAEVKRLVSELAVPALMVRPEEGAAARAAAFAAADAALVTSGTVVLEMAVAGTAMVSAYRANALTAAILRRLVRVDTANLVNLVSGADVVPELLQEHCTPDRIAAEVGRLITSPEARERQRAAFGPVLDTLGRGGTPPSVRAAAAVLRVLGR